MGVETFIEANNILGESPVWDYRKKELLWVDIEKCIIFILNIDKNKITKYQMKNRVGAIVPVENSTKYLLALQDGLAIFNRVDESLEYISNVESELLENRFNDGKCDLHGRFWVGSMNIDAKKGKGGLYCVDSTLKVTKMLSNITISNGLAWSDNNKVMYYIDTATSKVLQFDYNLEKGLISNSKKIIEIPKELGYPDGMCIDKENMLWIANWGGANISRWNPFTGVMLEKVKIPALNVASLCFGGENMEILYITSAKMGLTKEQRKKYPLSGSVFTYKPQIGGIKTFFFKQS